MCYWSNTYSPENNTIKVNLDFIERKGFFKKETHSEAFLERTFSDDEIAVALKEAKLELLDVLGENTFNAPKPNSQRNIYITRRI